MPNNPMLAYKPGLAMDEPVSITMAAADWSLLMSWMITKNLDGVTHLFALISEQIAEAIYSAPSLKAAHAHIHDQFPGTVKWIIQCGECGSQDEYSPYYNGTLTCGHAGERAMLNVVLRPGTDEI